jgi:hypothetical protein
MKEWANFFSKYAYSLLWGLGYDPKDVHYHISRTRENPIVAELRNDPDHFISIATEAGGKKGLNLEGCSQAVVLCQMMLYDIQGGPDMDKQPKGSRRHWYVYYKQFAQLLAFATGRVRKNALGQDEMIDKQWNGRMSQTYVKLVETGEITFKDLWVKDESRKNHIFGLSNALIPGLAIFVWVEKDSLEGDFVGAARAAGAVALGSCKGKQSFAAVEDILRTLGWREDYNPFEKWTVVFVHLSDHDYDGEKVIGKTPADQARRYLTPIHEARFGVMPQQVIEVYITPEDVWRASYQVKQGNDSYIRWAEEKALYWVQCDKCGREQYVIGTQDDRSCSDLCNGTLEILNEKEPHGFEVESLQTRTYYRALVKAILSKVRFSSVVKGLRVTARPSASQVVSSITDTILEENKRYQNLLKAEEVIDSAKEELKAAVEKYLTPYIEEYISENTDAIDALQDDPEPDDYEDHVVSYGTTSYAWPWQPFSRSQRVEKITEENEYILPGAREVTIDDYQDVVNNVHQELSKV